MIFEKSGQIESYLRHKLEVYKNSLNRKHKNMAQIKLLCFQSGKCSVFSALPVIYITDIGVQTNDYEEKNNCQIMNELKGIECLENILEKEIIELKSEISSLKSQLYQAKKDTILLQKKSLERENSLNLYNSDDNMATVIEKYSNRSNKKVTRQLFEGMEARVINDFQQYQTNA
ncbi:hypothetical protein RhiirA4_466421 [Rhizophagus irregularis]|uniref:Uncharacterized protein n=1 Tax=Rhizophagus irregularis TaxID=588596 RepID=A0A2I1GTZ9_9GLOM|nr:hypothetical protein RhiirA4_466421 [Rhizophagus irregularis]